MADAAVAAVAVTAAAAAAAAAVAVAVGDSGAEAEAAVAIAVAGAISYGCCSCCGGSSDSSSSSSRSRSRSRSRNRSKGRSRRRGSSCFKISVAVSDTMVALSRFPTATLRTVNLQPQRPQEMSLPSPWLAPEDLAPRTSPEAKISGKSTFQDRNMQRNDDAALC